MATTPSQDPNSPAVRRRRTWPLIATIATLAVASVGAVIAADAHKTIRLDVDGTTTQVATWAGSVANLLSEQGIEVSDRDVVAPGVSSALSEGGDVIVRFAREVTVSDGTDESTLWTTALDASEVLDSLAGRDEDSHLVASRSEARTALPIRLPTDEAVQVFVDGKALEVALGVTDVDTALTAAGVTLNELDEVLVDQRATDGSVLAAGETGVVTVVVRRVEVKETKKTVKVKFNSSTVKDADRYSDLSALVRTAGKAGKRTITYRVTTVDGEVTEKVETSDKVTTKAVNEVLVKGTKARPVVPATSTPDAKTPTGKAPTSGVWAKLAQCESGGRVNAVSSNGLYHGLYQFSVATWRGVGGSGLPSQASAGEQLKRAKMLQARSGWGQWPHCSAKLGLR